MYFSEEFFSTLVIAAIAAIAVSVFVLVWLLIKDAKTKSIW